jgi:hypothetical protein
MTSTAPSRPIGGRTRLLTAPAVAGVAYLLAWVTGLTVWPSNLDVAASGSQVAAAYTGHQGVAMTQSLLVHGVAAVALPSWCWPWARPPAAVMGDRSARPWWWPVSARPACRCFSAPLSCCWPARRSLTATAAGPDPCLRRSTAWTG